MNWYRIILTSVFCCLISTVFAKEKICDSVQASSTEYFRGVQIKGIASVSEGQYIRRYSSLTPLSDYKHTLVPGNLTQYENELKEINNRSNVKVYVLLINGLSLPHSHLVSDQVSDIQKVVDWAESEKKQDQYSLSDISGEAKEITERIAAKEARYLEGPVVFCSLVQFDIKYDASTCKKLTLYHATSYGFENGKGEEYLGGLDDIIRNSDWTNNAERTLTSLISAIRQRSQSYINEQFDESDLQALRARLMAISSRPDMNSEIDKLDPNIILGFDNELRAHVVTTLFTRPQTYTAGHSGVHMTYTDPSIYRNALTVLENVEDGNINSWYEYIKTTSAGIGSKTIFQKILDNVDGVLNDDQFLELITIITKQLKRTPDFSSRIENLFDQPDLDDKVIVWDKSYALKVTTPPIGTNSYKVEFQTDGSIKLIREYVKSWNCHKQIVPHSQYSLEGTEIEVCKASWESEPEIILDPFDLVVFIDRSDLAILDGVGEQNAQLIVVPAIMLKYAQDKKIKANMAAGFFLGLDAVTIVVPFASAYNLAKVSHRVYRVLDWAAAAGAAANIAVNINDYDQKYNNVIKAYNNITAALNLGTLAGSGARKLSDNFAGTFVSEMNQTGIKEGLQKLANGNDKVAARILELERELALEAKVAGKLFLPSPGGSFYTRLDQLGLSSLKEKVNLLDEATKAKFIDDFAGAGDDVLLTINKDPELINVWKKWESNGVREIDQLLAFRRVWKKKVRGISFDDFYSKTSYQINAANNKKFAAELFEAWEDKNVSGMEAIYVKFGLDPMEQYPPCEGVWGISEIRSPAPGEVFDRFQARDGIGGSYASPIGENELAYTIEARALKENYQQIASDGGDYFYFKFKFKNPPSSLTFEYGEAMPWFGKPGGAIQIKSNIPLHSLTEEIELLEKWKLVDGEWKIVSGVSASPVEVFFTRIDDLGLSSLKDKVSLLDEATKAKFLDDFDDAGDDFLFSINKDLELVDAWKALGEFPNLRKILSNLETLKKVKGRFVYNGKTGQEALQEIFTGHKSAQKFIDNIRKYDDIIGEVDGLTVTGIKSSPEVRILNNESQVGKIIDGRLHVHYSGFGGDIVCHSLKTTTAIGKYNPPVGVGTKIIIDSKLSKSGENLGGINILNDTRNMQGWSPQKIWDEVNQPWLDDAIARGDDIKAVSDPLDIKNVFAEIQDIPTNVFSSPEILANYLKNLNDPLIIDRLSFYGREIRHLSQNNYLFDKTTKTFVK